MSFASRHARPSRRRSQRGQAVLLVVLLLALGIGLFAYGAVSSVSLSQQQDVKTRLAMTQVRDALIGWSVARTSPIDGANARPGELPCPDINPLDGYEDGSCAAGAIGRVPWKTLGIPEPKDAAGETLWYTVAGPFQIWNLNFTVINSDTKGNITVYHNPGSASSTATTLTTEAVAVIFAPGAPLGTQDRSSLTTMACTAPSGTIARNLCASNYLEIAVGPSGNVNNATINGPFISARSSDPNDPLPFNDKVMVITTADLMPVVEQRVARELLAILSIYKAVIFAYPWPTLNDDGTIGRNRGRIPTLSAKPKHWGTAGAPQLPGWVDGTNRGWFVNNNWRSVIYYAVGKNYLDDGGSACTSCIDADLSVDGSTGKAVVILTSGPAGVSGSHVIWPTDYFEDPENRDDGNDLYVTPSSTAYARDRIYTIIP